MYVLLCFVLLKDEDLLIKYIISFFAHCVSGDIKDCSWLDLNDMVNWSKVNKFVLNFVQLAEFCAAMF